MSLIQGQILQKISWLSLFLMLVLGSHGVAVKFTIFAILRESLLIQITSFRIVSLNCMQLTSETRV